MVRQTGRRIVVSVMCMILLFTAGCSGKNEDGGNQEQALEEVREDTAGQEEQQGEDSEPKQLKQAQWDTKCFSYEGRGGVPSYIERAGRV